jgi:hypothetical protein
MNLLYLFKRAMQYFAVRLPSTMKDTPAPPGTFTEQELAELEIIWRELIKRIGLELGAGGVTRKDGAVVIDLKTANPHGSQIQIDNRWVTFKGAAGYINDAIIAGLTYFKEKNKRITIEGDQAFVRRVLALASEVGVMVDPRSMGHSQAWSKRGSMPQNEIIPQRGDPSSPLTYHLARRPG